MFYNLFVACSSCYRAELYLNRFGSSLQCGGLVGLFPREACASAAEVAEGGGLHVARLPQVEHLLDAGRGEVEVLCDDFFDLAVVNLSGIERVHENGNGLAVADGVGELDFATVGEACSHDVLGYVATAALGHFGRTGARFTWEKTDKAAALKKAAKI